MDLSLTSPSNEIQCNWRIVARASRSRAALPKSVFRGLINA